MSNHSNRPNDADKACADNMDNPGNMTSKPFVGKESAPRLDADKDHHENQGNPPKIGGRIGNAETKSKPWDPNDPTGGAPRGKRSD